MKRNLTAAMIEKLRPPASGRLEIFDAVLPWLAVRVTPKGYCSYVVRARIRGQVQPITYTIGSTRLIGLQEARQMARDVVLSMRRGEDPREAKRSQAASKERQKRTVFNAVAEAFINDHVTTLRSATHVASEVRRYLVAAWRDWPITSITVDDLAEVVQSIVDDGKPAQAHRVLATAKRLFRWAAAPARPRDERLAINPALSLTAKDFGLKPGRRQVALASNHIRLIWTCAADLGEPWTAFFRTLLLCGCRRGEAAAMRWDELDLDHDLVWVLPASRMKAKRPHEVPLGPTMVKLLQELCRERKEGPFVFGRRLSAAPHRASKEEAG
jgi:integrase